MTSEQEIIKEIDGKVYTYSIWTIGITDDQSRRRGEHGNPAVWHYWDAETETAARSIEKHFLDKGMKGASGGGTYPHYVYIYL